MRLLVPAIFGSAVAGCVLLAPLRSLTEIAGLHVLAACLLGFAMARDFFGGKQQKKWNDVQENVREAQRLLRQKPYGIFKYVSRKTVFGIEGALPISSTDDVLEEPMVWFFCVALYGATFLAPAYQEIDVEGASRTVELALLNAMQIVLLSVTVFGIARRIIRLKKKD